jgi:hypothetical protein
MHYISLVEAVGGVVLLYNPMHKFKHILCEDRKAGVSVILSYAGLTAPVWGQCHLVLHGVDSPCLEAVPSCVTQG